MLIVKITPSDIPVPPENEWKPDRRYLLQTTKQNSFESSNQEVTLELIQETTWRLTVNKKHQFTTTRNHVFPLEANEWFKNKTKTNVVVRPITEKQLQFERMLQKLGTFDRVSSHDLSYDFDDHQKSNLGYKEIFRWCQTQWTPEKMRVLLRGNRWHETHSITDFINMNCFDVYGTLGGHGTLLFNACNLLFGSHSQLRLYPQRQLRHPHGMTSHWFVQFLLQNGADPTKGTERRRRDLPNTPLGQVCQEPSESLSDMSSGIEIIKELVRAGADPNRLDRGYLTPLMRLLGTGSFDFSKRTFALQVIDCMKGLNVTGKLNVNAIRVRVWDQYDYWQDRSFHREEVETAYLRLNDRFKYSLVGRHLKSMGAYEFRWKLHQEMKKQLRDTLPRILIEQESVIEALQALGVGHFENWWHAFQKYV
ncbi:MAG: hypothetical protein CMD97_00040 [Gammaproteobacteria bacterium]|nr:hypothetical protein [Gammaproteobacteria bacterium]